MPLNWGNFITLYNKAEVMRVKAKEDYYILKKQTSRSIYFDKEAKKLKNFFSILSIWFTGIDLTFIFFPNL